VKGLGGTPWHPCENEVRGEHRTEVTEVTEGGMGLGRKAFWGTPWLPWEKQASREKHRTEVTEATEEELELGVERSWWTPWHLSEKRALKEEYRTEATEGNWGVESFPLLLICAMISS
jgi:hypothetical protein